MMQLVGGLALGGLAFALVAHAVLLLIAGLAGRQRGLAYPALVVAVASLLAWQGLVKAVWLTPLVAAALPLAAAFVLLRKWRRPRLPSLSRVEWLAVSLLALAALYAAFPDYRPDQWNNDLVVAKAVTEGPLRTPLFEEHVYCGGVYQYLFTLPRRLWGDDVFNQCAANAFSWLLLAFGLTGLLARMRAEAFPRLPPAALLVVWVVFALPDETSIANAKADPLILLAAAVLLDLTTGPRPGDSRRLHGLLFGFLLSAPLALKLTWLPFLCAAFLAWLFLLAIGRPAPAPARGPFLLGLSAGVVACLPWALTNVRFFANPLHPGQIGPFRSRFSGDVAHYWLAASGQVASAKEYIEALAKLPPMLSWHFYALVVPVLLVVLAGLVRGRRAPRVGDWGARLMLHSVVGGAFFLLVWPAFYPPTIYPRVLFAGVALLLAALAFALDRASSWGAATGGRDASAAWHRPVVVAALLLPLVLSTELPDHFAFMTRFALASRDRLFVEGPTGWRMVGDLMTVNRHRRRVSPEAGFFARTTLMDTQGGYLLDSVGFWVFSREYRRLEADLGEGTAARCPWLVLSRLDVAYLRARHTFEGWPEHYRRLLPLLPPLDPDGRVRYVAPRLLDRLAASGEACGGGPR